MIGGLRSVDYLERLRPEIRAKGEAIEAIQHFFSSHGNELFRGGVRDCSHTLLSAQFFIVRQYF